MKKSRPFLLIITLFIAAIAILSSCQMKKQIENEEPGKFPNDWFYRQRAYPYTELRSDLYYKAMGKHRQWNTTALNRDRKTGNS